MPERRVVITGLGVISPVGNDKDEFFKNLLAGKSGIGLIDRFDASQFPTKIAAQVTNFDVQEYIPRKDARRMDLFVQYACAAAKQAVKDAALDFTELNRQRIGVWIGSGIGGIDTLEKQHNALLKRGPGGVSPFFIPMMIANMAAGQVSILFGVKGPNGCTVTACASGTNSIGEALGFIRQGEAEVMITGGTEAAITPVSVAGFCAAKALSVQNEHPDQACRPFDAQRSGFVMGEGAGILILEEIEHARKRGAHIYAELIGYGASGDAVHVVQPDPDGKGAALAFRNALNDAGIEPEQVDYINAHGTGTELNDQMETKAIKAAFGSSAYKLSVSSIKAATGHMLGAAGAVELIATVLALQNSIIPPTLNLENPDADCDLDYTPLLPRCRPINVALSDSLGFGGHNAALLLRKV